MLKSTLARNPWTPWFLAFFMAVVEIATDIYAPVLSTLVSHFQGTEDAVSLTISIYFLALCISGPIYGPLSDAIGRRHLLLFGMAVFALFSALCSFAPSLPWLILYRFCQGLGGGVTWILGLTVIKDVYSSKESVRILSLMGTVVPLAPAVAPVLGAYIAKFWGWPSIFLFVTLCAALAFLIIAIFVEETLPQSKRQPLKFRMALCNYKTILKNPRFVGCSLISGLMFSGTVGYVATSAFYYVRVLGLDAEIYGYTQMFHVFGFIGGAWANQRLIEKLSSRRLLELGLWSTLGGALLLCLVSVFLPQNVWFLTAGMTCYALGVGLTFSNTSNHALDVFPQFKGASSAMLGTIEMGCMAVFVWFTNLLYTGTFLPVTLSILGCSVVNLALWEWIRVAFIANKREG